MELPEERQMSYMERLTFSFRPLRFEFLARQSAHFPAGTVANIVRGRLGANLKQISCVPECRDARVCPFREDCVYARLFEPTGESGPSGLMDRPRPFVIRAANLDGLSVAPGGRIAIGINLFDLHPHAPLHLIRAFARVAESGLGARPGSMELLKASVVDAHGEIAQVLYGDGHIHALESLAKLDLALTPMLTPVRGARIEFLTPTELKGDGAERSGAPPFHLLFSRIRDRVSNLRMLYGEGPLNIDFAGLKRLAELVEIQDFSLGHAAAERFSVRKGRRHPLGGIKGNITYTGELSVFLPYLLAAKWTGVGKHTVWGNGEIGVNYF
jgi:hypothetical protein